MSPKGTLRGTSEGQDLKKLDFGQIWASPADPPRHPFAPQNDVHGHLWASI